MRDQNIIGSKVRHMRSAQGLSQEELAARCNVQGWDISRATLSKIEAGLRRVNDAEVMVLARALGRQPADLFPRYTAAVLEIVRQGRA